jgi:hypothetical protein
MKWCNGCGTSKPEDAFSKRSNGILRAPCKECCIAYMRQWNAAHPTERRAHAKHWRATHRAERAAWQQNYRRAHPDEAAASVCRWNEKHPGANRAHLKVQRALKSGELTKSPFCQLCLDGEHVLDAHHHNGYEHPLDVIFLCHPCHQGLGAIGRKEN